MYDHKIPHPRQATALREAWANGAYAKRPKRAAGITCVNGKQTPEYIAYNHALARCTRETNRAWKDYGGRGIQFRYTSFEQFLADVGLRPSPAHSLDRRDNDGHYAPGNCRWATKEEQVANRRKYGNLLLFTTEELCAELARRGV